MISPTLRSTRLCLQLVLRYCVPPQPCHQQATLSVHFTTSCKYSLVLLRMGEIIARNMLNSLKLLINRYCCVYLVVYITEFLQKCTFMNNYYKTLIVWRIITESSPKFRYGWEPKINLRVFMKYQRAGPTDRWILVTSDRLTDYVTFWQSG